MDSALFEILLHEEEGKTLDFKRDQYRFAKASEDEKSELLKDLLGFANALRREDAYILIGVEDVRGGRGRIVGVAEHLDDHSVQQYVAHNTNRTLHFHYEAFTFEGKSVGVIRVDIAQDRPLSLVRDVGNLRAGQVYLRRGSYTDPTKPATADEIALMGRASVLSPRQPEIVVQFADVETGNPIGTSIKWKALDLRLPSKIPGYVSRRSVYEIGNVNFYREVADYLRFMNLFHAVRLNVQNAGTTPAEDVRIEVEVDAASTLSLKAYAPDEPTRDRLLGPDPALLRGIRQPIREAGDVEIAESTKNARLVIHCGNMQPGRRVPSETFYLAVRESGPTALIGQVFASTLDQPKTFTLTIDASVSARELTNAEIREFADEHLRP